jgi:hypothetical protein
MAGRGGAGRSTPERPFGFTVVCVEGIYVFSAANAEDRETWLSWLQKR